MKKIFLAAAVLGLVVTACKSEKKVDAQDAQDVVAVENTVDYTADVAQTTISWKGSHLGGLVPHNGTVKLKSGTVIVKGDKVTGGKFVVDFTTIENLDLAADTETQAKLLGHIKSADILNLEKFPEATFEITSVETAEGDFNSKVTGNLDFLGATKSIMFPANISIANGKASFDTDIFVIDRTQWGLSYGSVAKEEVEKMDESAKSKVISNDIEFKVNVIANK